MNMIKALFSPTFSKYIFGVLMGLFFAPFAWAQSTDFEVSLEEIQVTGFDGIHSAAVATYNGKVLIVGGRLNGLHAYLPPSAFPPFTQNNTLILLDIPNNQSWTADISTFPDSLREHLSSSNMQYAQSGDYLYFVGGYGYQDAIADFITFPKMTAIHVANVMQAIQNGGNLLPHFRQITHPNFAVTGGNLHKIDNTFYLAMGHTFNGKYNHNSAATYTQTYTHQIRTFEIVDNGTQILIQNYAAMTDTIALHRRDYNLVPQIFTGGTKGLTAFSGVFQKGKDLPFHNSVDITAAGFTENNSFQQNLNQYHTAYLPIYDSTQAAMHTFFFGGTSRFRPDSINPLLLKEDTLIPFVKTISQITRYNQTVTETHLPFEMPAYLGTNAVLVPTEQTFWDNHGILHLDRMDTTKTLVGYVIGGIESPRPNVFKGNEAESFASKRIFKVFIHKNAASSIDNALMTNLHLQAYPNPAVDKISFAFILIRPTEVSLFITDTDGKVVQILADGKKMEGKVQMGWEPKKIAKGLYFCNLQIGRQVRSMPFMIY